MRKWPVPAIRVALLSSLAVASGCDPAGAPAQPDASAAPLVTVQRPTQRASAIVAAARERLRPLLSPIELADPAAADPDADPVAARPVPPEPEAPLVERFDREEVPGGSAWLRPVFVPLPDRAAPPIHPADAMLPVAAGAPLRLVDRDTGLAIEVTLLDARPSTVETGDGWAVYPGAAPEGGDVLVRPSRHGVEDYVVFERRPARAEVRYRVALSAEVAGLRLLENGLEYLDADGYPRLRTDSPYVVDATGRRVAARLTVEGCAFDRDPRPPWRHATITPGADACTVRVSFEDAAEELAWPVVLDPSWVTTGSFNGPRSRHVQVLLFDGTVLMAGGMQGGSPLASANIFDPNRLLWTMTSSMPMSRSEPCAARLDEWNGAIVMGGADGTGQSNDDAFIYDLFSGSWSSVSRMNSERVGCTAVRYDADLILVAGGYQQGVFPGFSHTTMTEVFDIRGGFFTSVGSMTNGRHDHAMVPLADGRILVAGGRNGGTGNNYLSAAELWDQQNGWQATGSMISRRSDASYGAAPNGVAVIAGGYTAAGTMTRSAEYYDLSSEKFRSLPDMFNMRAEGVGAPVPGGFLVHGGQGSGRATEVVDGNSVWNLAPNSVTIRLRHAGTALADGRVLISGGESSGGGYHNSSEVFQLDPLGTACTTTAFCGSGFCADGVCCDAACNGACNACNQAGSLGDCGPVPAGSAGSPSCAPYVCNGAGPACPNSCTTDSGCASGNYCDFTTLTCVAQLPLGSSCDRPEMCQSDQCVDGFCCDSKCTNACDACNVAGAEGHCSVVPQGSAGDPSCEPFVCTGIDLECPASCNVDGDCASLYYCDRGACVPKLLEGSACDDGNQCVSGFCADDTCCNTACSGACDFCNGGGLALPGFCQNYLGGSPGSPPCAPYVCSGSSPSCPTTCAGDGNCTSDNFCQAGQCVAKFGAGQPCTGGNQCDSTFCVDGVCCNTICSGNCDRCNVSPALGTCTNVTGAGSPTSCSPYVCSGTSPSCPTSCTGQSNCASLFYCNGNPGSCVAQKIAGAACMNGFECQSTFCVDNVCCNTACGNACDRCNVTGSVGTCRASPAMDPGSPSCMQYVCNGTSVACPTSCTSQSNCSSSYYCNGNPGTCVLKKVAGASCSAAAECQSGFCTDGVCCNSDCVGGCNKCLVTGLCTVFTAGTPGENPSCGNYLCNGAASGACPTTCTADPGCVSGFYCTGTMANPGTCAAKKANGVACAGANQCTSGFCVDGFCCGTACTGGCDRCDTTPGTCTNVADGNPGANPSCSPYLCTGTSGACPQACASDARCASTHWCNGNPGTCVPDQANGATCTSGTQCTSGNCIDGYCCNAPCAGGCDRCDVMGSLGACTVVGQGNSGANPVCSPYVCNGTGAACPTTCAGDVACVMGFTCQNSVCTGKVGNGSPCTNNAQCQSDLCVDGVCCNTSCTGGCDRCDLSSTLGTCTVVPAGTQSAACGNYLCNGSSATCPGSCTADLQCVSGNYCNGNPGTCVAKKPTGQTCAREGECQLGFCVDGYCCDGACSGSCNRCNVAGKLGQCSFVSDGGSPSCMAYLCSGSSASCPTSCTAQAQCASTFYCTGDAVMPGTCAAKLATGTACTASVQCTSTFCVDGYCCNVACGGACDACSIAAGGTTNGTCTPAAAGHAGNPACGAYVCSGSGSSCPSTCATDAACAANFYCSGSTCTAKKSTGTACGGNTECISGFCVDGFCCNLACAGRCDVCSAAAGASQNGTCTNLPASNPGTTPGCAPYVCSGSSGACPTSCISDVACQSGMFCNGNNQCVPKLGNGAACTGATQCTSGFCVDNVCCNAACGGACDACTAALGASADGTCTNVSGAGTPSCTPYLCRGIGSACPTTCTGNSDCDAASFCNAQSKCTAKLANGAACTGSPQCTSGFCVDGVCCNAACTAQCAACNVAGALGTCSPVTGAPVGTRTACLSDGSACGGACDGTNTAACAYPGNATICRQPSCASGTGVLVERCNSSGSCPAPTQVACAPYVCGATACKSNCTADADCVSGYFCNASNQCVQKRPNGQACTGSNQCSSGSCADGFCCNVACSASCDRCDLPGSQGICGTAAAGYAGAPSCTPYLCDGIIATCPGTCAGDAACASTFYCSGNACVSRKSNGATCAAANECLSGFCVDGVCCNAACSAQCAACDLAGKVGTCSPVTGPPTGGRPACTTDGTVCGGACDGVTAASCTYPGAATSCRAASCTTGVGTLASSCDGTGRCPETTVVCAPYQCGPTACKTSCVNDGDCIVGGTCIGSACTGKLANGQSCTGANQCTSNFCVDGVCCNAACDAGCDRCNRSGSVGTCGPVADGDPGAAPVCAPYLCNGALAACPATCVGDGDCTSDAFCSGGQCLLKLASGTPCTGPGQCATGFCVDGYCCSAACSGACDRCDQVGAVGVCSPVAAGGAGTPACAPYLCDGSAASCPTSCSSDDGCVSGRYCAAGTCAAKLAAGAACIAGNQCTSGSCADGVCCNAACDGGCDRCDAVGSVGTCTRVTRGSAGAPSCAPYVCDGLAAACPSSCAADDECAAGWYCGAMACLPKLSTGAACSAANQCTSSFCVDGFCCNAACGGACDACSLALGAMANGTCSNAAGPGAPSCAPYLCTGAGSSCPSTCSQDAHCAGSTFCQGNACVGRRVDGSSCSRAEECASGFCADGVCCDSACAGSCDACSVPLGASANGVCTAVSGPGLPLCTPYLCDGTGFDCPALCVDDGDCVMGHFCHPSSKTCVPKMASGSACTSTSQCQSGFCVDGFCCNNACRAQCAACNVPGAIGTCSVVSGQPVGGRLPCLDDGTACGGFCDGVSDSCTYATPSTLCRNPSCTGGRAFAVTTCDGAGTCPPASETPCAPYVCGGSTCRTSCGSDGDCATGALCMAGRCVGLVPDGTPCATGAQCQSNFCVDGVCCNAACAGQCEACSVAGKVGTCSPVTGAPVGLRAACAGSGSCGGRCDGAVRLGCAYPAGETSCRSATCAGGMATAAASCDGAGACPAAVVTGCGAFACGATACRTDCSVDADCASGFWCDGAACQPKIVQGSACGSNHECGSGFCVDGVCCNAACTAQCHACNVAGLLGTCTPTTGQPVGARPACTGDGGPCTGSCDGAAASCVYPSGSVQCRAAACAAGTATSSAVCDGAGSCPAKRETACGAYGCDQTACKTSCANDNDCAAGAFCDAAKRECRMLAAPGRKCAAGVECASGFCADGVCCDTACQGQCSACNVPDRLGSCVAITGAPVGGRAACTGAGPCGGACDGTGKDACVYALSGASCGEATCSDGVARAASTCDGMGLCKEGATTDCGRAGCNGVVCATPPTPGGPGDDQPVLGGQPVVGCDVGAGRSGSPGRAWLTALALVGMALLRRSRRRP